MFHIGELMRWPSLTNGKVSPKHSQGGMAMQGIRDQLDMEEVAMVLGEEGEDSGAIPEEEVEDTTSVEEVEDRRVRNRTVERCKGPKPTQSDGKTDYGAASRRSRRWFRI